MRKPSIIDPQPLNSPAAVVVLLYSGSGWTLKRLCRANTFNKTRGTNASRLGRNKRTHARCTRTRADPQQCAGSWRLKHVQIQSTCLCLLVPSRRVTQPRSLSIINTFFKPFNWHTFCTRVRGMRRFLYFFLKHTQPCAVLCCQVCLVYCSPRCGQGDLKVPVL